MKLLFICNEPPYPPTHGGRADIWRRIKAMRQHGVELMLTFWAADVPAERPTDEAMSVMREVAREIHWCVISRALPARLRRAALLVTHHSHVVSRMLNREDLQGLIDKARAFQPDAIWIESIYGGHAAQAVAQALDVPLYVRSANIEHLYAAKQAQRALHLNDRLRWASRRDQLRRLEVSTLRTARQFFDISADDMAWWHAQGLANGSWLPSLVDDDFGRRLAAPRSPNEITHDVGYLGNLFAPNNVEGLLWYLQQVVPLLRARTPQVRIFVAGSRPNPEVEAAARNAGIDLIPNPPDAVAILRSSHVLVNPVFAGSGVNIKSIDMLYSPAELVSTPEGLAGMPSSVKSQFAIASEPQAFAEAVQQRWQAALQGAGASPERIAAREVFGSAAIRSVLGHMASRAHPASLPLEVA